LHCLCNEFEKDGTGSTKKKKKAMFTESTAAFKKKKRMLFSSFLTFFPVEGSLKSSSILAKIFHPY